MVSPNDPLVVPGHEVDQTAGRRNRFAGHSQPVECVLNALGVGGVERDNNVGFRFDFQHSLGFFVKASSGPISLSKEGQQAGQRWIAVGKLLADVIVKFGMVRPAGQVIERDHTFHQLQCQLIGDLSLQANNASVTNE